ncbi:HAD family hydrolase [Streptomyces sp. NPDC059224]|uniref:HAD family hydrolase n=1 Tax=Streptomyces sp. NPDC059224 TaxID=3346775 RepID=UPI0036BDDA2F
MNSNASAADPPAGGPAGTAAQAVHRPIPGECSMEPIELVMLDIGGPVYDDACYSRALLQALRELGADVDELAFHQVRDDHRRAQRGSLRTRIARAFLPDGDRDELSALAARYWQYPPQALYTDVLPALKALAGRYRIAVVANQNARVQDALRRDGVAPYIDVWALSEVVGAEKPDPAIFLYALTKARVSARRAVHVGNRLDNDVRAARSLGLRTVWVLRGEAPDAPTPQQLAEADTAISSLAELPEALELLQRSRSGHFSGSNGQ